MNKTEAVYDEFNFAQDKYITKNLEDGEKIYLTTLVDKFNHRGKKQQRVLLITNRNIYNVSVPNILKDLFATVSPSVLINRKIPYNKVTGITVSTLKKEFTIHIPAEHDYRLNTERRDVVLEMIVKAYIESTKKTHMAFFYKNEMSTIDYTTTKTDLRKNFDRRPREKPEFHDLASLKKRNEEINYDLSNSGVLYTYSKEKVSIDDFNFLKVLGRGAFGKVTLVEKKDTKEIFALKSLRKEVIIQKEQIEHTKMEKRILSYVTHPFLVKLMWAFQTNEKIFFVMQFLRGGELFTHLKVSRRFNEERTRFYAAEILLALDYLHANNIIYRDLKPENLLLDEEGHICLTDFGLARFIPPDKKATTFVGTPEYLAPELILNKGHGKPADWWSLGSVMYYMSIPPFYNKNQNFMFQLIKEGQLKFPSQLTISENAQNLILKLLDKNPETRLGTSGSEEIKNHPWFAGINWEALLEKKVQPPFKPKVSGKLDVDNFDEEFTSENPMNSMLTSSQLKLVEKHKQEFEYFDKEFDEEFDHEAEMKAYFESEHNKTASGDTNLRK